MLYASIIIIILLICLYVMALRHSDKVMSGIDRQKHRFYFLYPMAGLLLNKTGLYKKLENKTDITKRIRALHTSDHHESQVTLYWYKKTSLFLFIIFIFSCVSMITSLQETINKSQLYETNLLRPEVGEGDSHTRLQFKMENNKDKEDVFEGDITINNKERVYTDREWREVLHTAIPYLEKEMLGENTALEYVYKDLNCIRDIPGTGIVVEWIPKDYRLISGSGKLMNEDMTDDKADTLITATLKYKDKVYEHRIPLTIWPAKSDKKALLYRELQNTLDKVEEETATAKKWSLPKSLGEYFIIWQIPKSNLAFSVLVLGFAGSVLLWVFMDKSLDDKMKLRNNQMLLDYPDIINKFSLLVNAGMTIRQAWSKISEDYQRKPKLRKGQARYAYEEMLVTLHELKLGIPEVNAYEEFGIRAGLMPYMKFSSMLAQNLKKGNKNMIEMLKQEAVEAFHERKENTKRLGEEASTKLLGPMIMMLLIVLIIILIPAFISFQM